MPKQVHSSQFTVHSTKKTVNRHLLAPRSLGEAGSTVNSRQWREGLPFRSPSTLIRAKEAQILAYTLLILVVVVILALAMLNNVAFHSRFGSRSVVNEQATQLAEAGVDLAIKHLNSVSVPLPHTSPDMQLDPGYFTYTITDPGGVPPKRHIQSTGCVPNCTNHISKRTVDVETTAEPTPIPFLYTWQAGSDGIEFTDEGSCGWQVFGPVRSNASIVVNSPCLGEIHGDTKAAGGIAGDVTVQSPPYIKCESCGTEALPTFDVDSVIRAAQMGWWLFGDQTIDDLGNRLGPKSILGDLQLNDFNNNGLCELTITGPLYITGDLLVDKCNIYLDSSYGPLGEFVIVEHQIEFGSDANIYKTSQDGYLLFSSLEADETVGILIEGRNGRTKQAIFHALSSAIKLDNLEPFTTLEGAIIGQTIIVKATSAFSFIQGTNLSTAGFQHSISPWQIIRGTYEISK